MKFYTTVYKKECKSLEYYLCPGAIANRVKCKLMVADCWLRTKTNTLAARSSRTGLIFDTALRTNIISFSWIILILWMLTNLFDENVFLSSLIVSKYFSKEMKGRIKKQMFLR